MRLPAFTFLAAGLIASTAALAADPLPVPSVGMMHDIPGAHETPDPTLDYKLVFDVQTTADSAGEVSPGLQSIGGLINTFRHNGVPASHMHMVAVFHGKTILLVTNDQTYSQRTGVKTNPNDEIIQQLKAAGVLLAVCGQSAMAQHYAVSDLQPSVQTNLSATITFINLQTRGYVLVRE